MLKLDKTTPMGSNIHYFLKWTFISCVIGVTVGVIGAVFGRGVAWVTNFWNAHAWTLFLAPLAGLLIVWLYHMFHEEGNRGTNLVLESISRRRGGDAGHSAPDLCQHPADPLCVRLRRKGRGRPCSWGDPWGSSWENGCGWMRRTGRWR